MLEDEPELDPHLFLVWRAFITLDRSRQYGYGHPQPLLFSEMASFAKARDRSGEQFSEMIHNLQFMDQIYLEFHAKRIERERKSKSK